MGFFDNIRKLTKKERNKERMQKIRESGKEGERHFEQDNIFSKIKRVHHGADYVKTVRDSAGRERKEHHEVKRNNSPLSKLQKKTRGLIVHRYVKTPYGEVEKLENRKGEELKQDPWTNKRRRMSKLESAGVGGLFGSGSSSKRKKSSRSGYASLFGSGSSSKPKKSSRSNYASLFGSGSSKRKKSSGSSSASIWGTSSSSKPKKSSRSSSASIWGSSSSSKRKKNTGIW